jgi:hypothetical protein
MGKSEVPNRVIWEFACANLLWKHLGISHSEMMDMPPSEVQEKSILASTKEHMDRKYLAAMLPPL